MNSKFTTANVDALLEQLIKNAKDADIKPTGERSIAGDLMIEDATSSFIGDEVSFRDLVNALPHKEIVKLIAMSLAIFKKQSPQSYDLADEYISDAFKTLWRKDTQFPAQNFSVALLLADTALREHLRGSSFNPIKDWYNNLAIIAEGDYTDRIMNVTEDVISFAARKGVSVAQLEEIVDNWKAAESETAGRGNRSRTTTQPRLVTAEELDKVPPGLRVKQHKKYDFAPELLADPERVIAEKSIANARNRKLQDGEMLTDEEDERGRMAEAFVKQARRRRSRTATPKVI